MRLSMHLLVFFIFEMSRSVTSEFILKPCNYKDSNFNLCVQHGFENLLKQLKNSVPELDLPSIEPIRFANLTVQNHHLLVLSLEEKVENVAFYGLSTAKVSNFNVDFVKNEMLILLEVRRLSMDLNLTLNGEAYLEPVHFKGFGVAGFDNTKLNITAPFEIYRKDDKKYIKILHVSILWTFTGGSFPIKSNNLAEAEHLENLLKKHYKDMFNVVKPDYEALLASAFLSYGNQMFSKISITELFGFL